MEIKYTSELMSVDIEAERFVKKEIKLEENGDGEAFVENVIDSDYSKLKTEPNDDDVAASREEFVTVLIKEEVENDDYVNTIECNPDIKMESEDAISHGNECNKIILSRTTECQQIDRFIKGGNTFFCENTTRTSIDVKRPKEKRHTCTVCNYKAVKRSRMAIHMRMHTGEKPFMCRFCEYKTSDKSNLFRHTRRHAGEANYEEEFKKSILYGAEEDGPMERIIKEGGVGVNQEVQENYEAEENQYKVQKNKITEDYGLIKEDHLEEDANTTKFNFETNLKIVASNNVMTSKNTVSIGANTATKRNINVMEYKFYNLDASDPLANRSIKSKNELFLCYYCKFKCRRRQKLKLHMLLHIEKGFRVNYCFSKAYVLENGQEFYRCNFCIYTSTERSRCTRHLQVHTGEGTHICQICNYIAPSKFLLNNHILMHKCKLTYVCDLCNYRTFRKDSFVVHKRMHSGEKPFSCFVCNYKTTSRTSLTRHYRTHSEEKPHACNFCNFRTKRKCHLNSHMRVHVKP